MDSVLPRLNCSAMGRAMLGFGPFFRRPNSSLNHAADSIGLTAFSLRSSSGVVSVREPAFHLHCEIYVTRDILHESLSSFLMISSVKSISSIIWYKKAGRFLFTIPIILSASSV